MGTYTGFEQGPIRPPSEASSLLIRVTRNCPWNRCTFCSIYKREKFSLRSVDDVINDIDYIYQYVNEIGGIERDSQKSDATSNSSFDGNAYFAARNWFAQGMESVFLQDADSLVIRPDNLIRILTHIRERFPSVERITSYARSDSVARISEESFREIADAGLNRIHIGLETSSDTILKMIQKGVTKEIHIQAGLKVKNAGIELSEYVLTGIGGGEFYCEHALETADALNQINPDFIRFRTLHIAESTVLYPQESGHQYQFPTDLELAREIHLFIEHLDGISSRIKSDHMLNLFQEIDGTLPQDKERLLEILQAFIQMPPEDQILFQVGKRLGYFSCLGDMSYQDKLAPIKSICRQYGLTPENADAKIHEMVQERMKRGMGM
jgi:histone acetyltransferase (RNA polymerase elongator complex component)